MGTGLYTLLCFKPGGIPDPTLSADRHLHPPALWHQAPAPSGCQDLILLFFIWSHSLDLFGAFWGFFWFYSHGAGYTEPNLTVICKDTHVVPSALAKLIIWIIGCYRSTHPWHWDLKISWGWCPKRAKEPQWLHAAMQKPGKPSLQQLPQGTAPCREATRGTGRALPQGGCFLGKILFPSPVAPVIPGSYRIPLSPYESSCRAWGSLLGQPWSVKLHLLKCFQGAFLITGLFSYLGKYLFS